MQNRNLLTKILALVGAFLVWMPLLAPLFFSVLHFVRARRFLVDFLMPAELFPAVLVGGGLLLWAALRLRSHRALIGGALGAAVVLLLAGQALAVVTGLASGETEPTGWPWAIVMGAIVLYILAVIAMGLGGELLLHNLFDPRGQPRGTIS